MSPGEVNRIFDSLNAYRKTYLIPHYLRLKLSLQHIDNNNKFNQIINELNQAYTHFHTLTVNAFKGYNLNKVEQFEFYHFTFTLRQNHQAHVREFNSIYIEQSNFQPNNVPSTHGPVLPVPLVSPTTVSLDDLFRDCPLKDIPFNCTFRDVPPNDISLEGIPLDDTPTERFRFFQQASRLKMPTAPQQYQSREIFPDDPQYYTYDFTL